MHLCIFPLTEEALLYFFVFTKWYITIGTFTHNCLLGIGTTEGGLLAR